MYSPPKFDSAAFEDRAVLFNGSGNIPGQIHNGLSSIHRRHDIGSGRGFQAELLGYSGDLRSGKHQPTAQEHIFIPDHKSRNQNGGLQERCQAKSCNLAAPAVKSIRVASGKAEQIKASHRNLNQQNPASLEIGKKDFDDTVPHQNQSESAESRLS